MDALCQCLFVAVSCGSQKKHKKILLSKSGMWPSSLDELIPTDAKAYIRWAGTLPRWHAFAFMSRLVVVARRRIMEDLSLSPSRDQICAAMIRSMRLWRVPDSEFPPEMLPHLLHDIPLGRPRHEDATQLLRHAMGLLIIFEDGPDRTIDDFRFFSTGYERLLHDAILAIAGDPSFPTDLEHRNRYIGVASILCAWGDLPIHPLVQEAREPKTEEELRYNPARDGLNVADAVLVYFRQRRDDCTCSGPGCGNYARMGETGTCALSICGKCKFLRYCSPECQRRDWSVGRNGVPHKVICSALCKLDSAGVSPRATSMAAFAEVYFDQTTLTDEEYILLAQCAVLDQRLPMELRGGILDLFVQHNRGAADGGAVGE